MIINKKNFISLLVWGMAGLTGGELVCGQMDGGLTSAPMMVDTIGHRREPMGPSSRRTSLVFSEVMYHPLGAGPSSNRLEFIELYNAGVVYQDMSGWRLSGGIQFQFPNGYRLAAGGVVVIASNPNALQAAYGITGILGPFAGALDNRGETLRLQDRTDAVKLEMSYSPDAPWPAPAAGGGHSLVLSHPSYGEEDARAWSASEQIGGSPGQLEAVLSHSWNNIVINEFLVRTDNPQQGFVELYNHSTTPVDLSGCWITDNLETAYEFSGASWSAQWLADQNVTNRFRIPNGTVIPARGFLWWNFMQLGFRLQAQGDGVWMVNPSATRLIDAIRFGGQEEGVSFGRTPDGNNRARRLSQSTPGLANAPRRLEVIVINELMYAPLSGLDDDEYLELYNRSDRPVDLSGWRFSRGVDFEFPAGTVLAAGAYGVIARNAARLKAQHAILNDSNCWGDYQGVLRDSGETVELSMPQTQTVTNALGEIEINQFTIAVSEVTYADGGRWGYYADGGGSSLELADPETDPWLGANWADSDESQKAPWTEVAYTGVLSHGNGSSSPNRLHLGLLGAGECLVDDVQIFKAGGLNLLTNAGFELGSAGWGFYGNHSTSFIQTNGAAEGSQCLHVRSQGDLDTGINSIRAPLASGLANGNTATLKARVRWLAGWPELLMRTRGNWIELPARMTVPQNLGTPGVVNSRRVANLGPAIWSVAHDPALPRANEAVVISCRFSDPHGFGSLRLRYRLDPDLTLTSLAMRDDGTGGDSVAGDGVYSATLSGRASGSLVAFRIEATDGANPPASSTFPKPETILPAATPQSECLIRWGDPIPTGTFGHYHLWNTRATDSQRGNALNNTYRDCTLVYGNFRIIYNAGFRDKGSPYHQGRGDYAVTVPSDDKLLGVVDRVFASTGNGGSEASGVRGQVSAWIGERLGIPYLHSHYVHVFRNGTRHQNISEDLEQPNHYYAESWFPEGSEGDLHKVAVWFEFDDNFSQFNATGATLQSYQSEGAYKMARYRWNWQRRPKDETANNFTNVFELVSAANNTTTNYANRLLEIADMEEWMRVFAYNRILGNWDAWTFNVGQNTYAYRQPGRRWVLIPWDIDFVLGLGNGASDPLGGGSFGGNCQDSVANRFFNEPAFRRMLWRAHQDAAHDALLPENYSPQIEARYQALQRNSITGVSGTNGIYTYINSRRTYILNQLKANDAAQFAITNNGGRDFSTTQPTVKLSGTAPFAIAQIEVNGTPYPVRWTTQTSFEVTVRLTQTRNEITLVGTDRLGRILPGQERRVVVTYTGSPLPAIEPVVINEIYYHPWETGASFIELYNPSTAAPFNLSGCRLVSAGYTFPEGSVLLPNSYLLLVQDREAFARAFGITIPVFDEFPGSLSNGGEHLRLIRPGTGSEAELVLGDVSYEDQLPWPVQADGGGSSLQLIDPLQDTWRVGNWAALGTNEVNRVTPGRVNAARQPLQSFPSIWLNEVVPNNLSGPTDNRGEHEPYIELYNSGNDPVSLAGLFLANNFTNLIQWPFPSNATLGSKAFLVIWADGQTGQTETGAIHANFRLDPEQGSIALARRQGGAMEPAVMDYLDYEKVTANRGFGNYPDGQPRMRRTFFHATPGAPNNPEFPQINVVFNEVMAANTRTIFDPLDSEYADWFELFNAGAEPVDLAGYYLTDQLSDTNQFEIPPGYVIGPGQFLLVWADKDVDQNSSTQASLHVNFELAANGEQLGLFAPDGQLVDHLEFGAQTSDISMGRYPDGIEGALIPLDTATPGEPNQLTGGNRPPVIESIPSQIVLEEAPLVLGIKAADPDPAQTLSFSFNGAVPEGMRIETGSGKITWIPTEVQGPGEYRVTIQVTDSGQPARSAVKPIQITVLEQNRSPVIEPVAGQTVDEGAELVLSMAASDPDWPANDLAYSLEAGSPEGASIDAHTGQLIWSPTEEAGGKEHTVIVRVTDSGTPPLSDTHSIVIRVVEVNNAPVIDPIPWQSIAEGQLLTLRIPAFDPDGPSSALVYGLEEAIPEGLHLDASSGVLTWRPNEDQGPGDYVVLIRATENGGQGLSTTRNLSIQVLESNQPPILLPIEEVIVEEGDEVRVLALATDEDRPAQSLSFELGVGAPPGAAIDAHSGVFSWTTPEDAGASTHVITIRVKDDGPGNLSNEKTFRVEKIARFRVVVSEIMYKPGQAGAEFIEVYNASAKTAWDISGYRLAGRTMQYVFPTNTRLEPGAALCVAGNASAFVSAYGSQVRFSGVWTGSLGESGDDIQLIRPGPPEHIVDRVQYTAEAPWPAAANGGGASLQVIDPQQDRSRPANWMSVTRYEGPRQLVSITNQWRYYESGPVDASWAQPSFNDSRWPSGRALLYVEGSALPAPKNTPLTLGQNTYYFRAAFVLPSIPSGASLVLSNIIDDGAAFYLNGREIHRQGIEDGPIDFGTPGSDFLSPGNAVGDAAWAGPFTLPSTGLVAGTNVLAAEVHQINSTSSDIVFGCSLDLEGGSLDPSTPGLANNVTQALPEFPPLWINELAPRGSTGFSDHQQEGEPWIELYNSGPSSVRLEGFYLSDALSHLDRWAFPTGAVLQPNQYLVVIADGEAGESRTNQWHANFRLNPEQGGVVLSRMQLGAPAVLDFVAYANAASNQTIASLPNGQSFLRVASGQPTPGQPNSVLLPALQLMAQPQAGGAIYLEWNSIPGVSYRLECKDQLNESNWRLLVETTSQSASSSYSDRVPQGQRQRFYRLAVP